MIIIDNNCHPLILTIHFEMKFTTKGGKFSNTFITLGTWIWTCRALDFLVFIQQSSVAQPFVQDCRWVCPFGWRSKKSSEHDLPLICHFEEPPLNYQLQFLNHFCHQAEKWSLWDSRWVSEDLHTIWWDSTTAENIAMKNLWFNFRNHK